MFHGHSLSTEAYSSILKARSISHSNCVSHHTVTLNPSLDNLISTCMAQVNSSEFWIHRSRGRPRARAQEMHRMWAGRGGSGHRPAREGWWGAPHAWAWAWLQPQTCSLKEPGPATQGKPPCSGILSSSISLEGAPEASWAPLSHKETKGSLGEQILPYWGLPLLARGCLAEQTTLPSSSYDWAPHRHPQHSQTPTFILKC